MNRLLALLTAGLVAGVAVADVAPPAGFKRVQVVHKITTDKEFTLYSFYTVAPVLKEAVAVKLDPKTPIEIDRPGLIGATELVAVPKDAAKKYASEKELLAAIAEGKVEGTLHSKTTFFCRGTVKEPFKGDTLVVEYKLEKLDAKEGLVVTKKATPKGKDLVDDADQPTIDDFGASIEDMQANGNPENPLVSRESTSPAPSAYTPRGGMWFAGLAAALALTLGGFWLASRARRKV